MNYPARLALTLALAALALPAAAQDCKPTYGWNPLHWWADEVGAKVACDVNRQIEELSKLPPEQALKRIEEIKAQGGGDPRRIPIPGMAAPAQAPGPAPIASPAPVTHKDLDTPTR